jgi:thioredoxin 1
VDAPAVDDQSTDVPVSGQYVDLATYRADPAAYAGTKVVLFFHASWCPQCREVEQSLTSAPVPAGLTVVKVDYDTQTHLRRTYGVTIQHTFVQVDPSDPSQAALATWSVATTADQILAKTV